MILEKQKSNGDRFREMTDEELGKFLLQIGSIENPVPFCQNKPVCGELLDKGAFDEIDCMGCMLEYLKRPAEVSE